MRGRLVAFEGIDGSGKTSALAQVAQRLAGEGVPVESTREETTGETGAWVRASIADGLDPLATLFLFLADRAQHVPQIASWQARGRHVLCDRFMHSTLAYQAVTLRERWPDPLPVLRAMHDGWCPMPDKVVLFKADPARSVARTRSRAAATSRYEKERFLADVQEAYLRLAHEEKDRFVVLDAERPLPDLVDAALREVRRAFA